MPTISEPKLISGNANVPLVASTVRVFDPVAGTFSGIAMGLNAVVTALVAPVLLRLLL